MWPNPRVEEMEGRVQGDQRDASSQDRVPESRKIPKENLRELQGVILECVGSSEGHEKKKKRKKQECIRGNSAWCLQGARNTTYSPASLENLMILGALAEC